MARLTGTHFMPAKPSRVLIAPAALLNRALLSRHTTLDVRQADLVLLRSLPPGCLIAPNHAHYADPQVTFELARRAGRRFIYMATREVFDVWGGWLGGIIQRLGVFSVNRGGDNQEALRFARSILIAGDYDLLMFPEGEVYLLNDHVMPLKPGAARLALEAADELKPQGRSRRLFIVPVAVKYQFCEDVTPALEAVAARVEEAVLGQVRSGSLHDRIMAVGTELLARAERRYGVEPAPGEGPFERVRRLRRHLLEKLERKYFGGVREGLDFDRARKLMIRIREQLRGPVRTDGYYGAPEAPAGDPITADLETAHLCARSVSFQDDYLARHPSPERIAETLTKLEREVLGKEIHALLGRRRAIVRIAAPLDVGDFLATEAAGTPREETIDAIVVRLYEALQEALEAIHHEVQETSVFR